MAQQGKEGVEQDRERRGWMDQQVDKGRRGWLDGSTA